MPGDPPGNCHSLVIRGSVSAAAIAPWLPLLDALLWQSPVWWAPELYSVKQLSLHPSPFDRLPSSHSSPAATAPLPHASNATQSQ